MPNPILNPVILLSPVEEGYVAYDPVRDYLHQLNPLAALLAELCDGAHSLSDLRELAGPLAPEGEIDAIDRWVDQALKVGLLVEAGSEDAARPEMTAPELTEITKRLKANGEVQAAHMCITRAVELAPDDSDAWYELGDIAQCLGKRDEARVAYQKYFDANPDDGEIEHLLIALRDDAPPPRASDRAIQHIYKAFAASYETRMLDDLKYVGPQRIGEAITAVIGDLGGLDVLDIGCGSGLGGLAIKPRAARLTGIDLSPEMIELARARDIYDRLEVAEITAWLDADTAPFDMIVACDCLIYFGDLSVVAAAAGRRLKPGGVFVFSTERGERKPFFLADTGRYTHHRDHPGEVAAATGLQLAYLNESFLRWEYGEEVGGLFAVLRRPE